MTSSSSARRIAKITVGAAVGLNLLVFGALALAGVPLIHLGDDDAAARADDIRIIPIASTDVVPARQVVRQVLSAPVAGAKATGPVWVANGSPFDKACPDRSALAPAVSYARPFRVSGQVVSVRISAYGAGQGASAIADLGTRLSSCRNAGSYGASLGPTSTAVVAWSQSDSSNASSLVWNRSDVVASVTTTRSSGLGLAAIAQAVDNTLLEALDGTCAAAKVTVADIGRSPWTGRRFTGNQVPQPVVLTYPTPSASPTAVLPSGIPTVPVPAPTFITPTLAPLPFDATSTATPPAAPIVTPPGSDAGVLVNSAPVAPVAPSSPPATQKVDHQMADPVGPGCGWAFTKQGAPPFDAAAADAKFAADTLTAQQQLQAADALWQQARAAYTVSYATYLAEVDAFTKYARAHNAYVASNASSEYQRLLAEYNAAVAARSAFEQEQADAQAAYEAALEACAAVGSPTAEPSPTESPTPTESPLASPSAPAVECPPAVPPILSQPAPTVPPSPEPPN